MCDGKLPYQTESMAAIAAAKLEGQRIDTLFWYECPICGSWHLTRSPQGKNIEYYTKIKRDIIEKYNNTTPAKLKKDDCPSLTRHKLINNCTSLDEIKRWNEENPGLKISIRKVVNARKFDKEYVETWKKANPEAL